MHTPLGTIVAGKYSKWLQNQQTFPNQSKYTDFYPNPKTGLQNRLFQRVQKQSSRLRSCTLCVQGSAQKQDVAEPLCRPPSLTQSVHAARPKGAETARSVL